MPPEQDPVKPVDPKIEETKPVDPKIEETKPVDPKIEETKPVDQNKTIKVDFKGVEIEISADKAKKLIEVRDQDKALVAQLNTKLAAFENEIADTKRQKEATEAALKGELAKAEEIFSAKANEKLSRLQARIIKSEIRSQLVSNSDFIGSDYVDDAYSLILANKVELTEDGSVKIGEKSAKEFVDEFVKSKPIFQKPKTNAPKFGPTKKQGEIKTAPKPTKSLGAMMHDRMNPGV